jgi:hypothetical protein
MDFRARLDAAVRHHARMTGVGDDPRALLNHAMRLRESAGASQQTEMDDLIASLEADVVRAGEAT